MIDEYSLIGDRSISSKSYDLSRGYVGNRRGIGRGYKGLELNLSYEGLEAKTNRTKL